MAAKSDAKGPETAGEEEVAAAAPKAGGIKQFIPLLANVVLMPVLAFVMVKFVLAPQLTNSAAKPAEEHAAAAAGKEKPAEGEKGKKEGKEKPGGSAQSAQLSRVVVNVANTQMSRFLQATIVLEGVTGIKDMVEKREAKLKDAANSVLSSKSISDLEKPGSKNQIRGELKSVFNNILGEGVVGEVLLPEFAVQ